MFSGAITHCNFHTFSNPFSHIRAISPSKTDCNWHSDSVSIVYQHQHSDVYTRPYSYCNAYMVSYCNTIGITHLYTNCNANPYSDSYVDFNPNCNEYFNADIDADSNINRYSCRDIHPN